MDARSNDTAISRVKLKRMKRVAMEGLVEGSKELLEKSKKGRSRTPR